MQTSAGDASEERLSKGYGLTQRQVADRAVENGCFHSCRDASVRTGTPSGTGEIDALPVARRLHTKCRSDPFLAEVFDQRLLCGPRLLTADRRLNRSSYTDVEIDLGDCRYLTDSRTTPFGLPLVARKAAQRACGNSGLAAQEQDV